jgi:hypothetical protein
MARLESLLCRFQTPYKSTVFRTAQVGESILRLSNDRSLLFSYKLLHPSVITVYVQTRAVLQKKFI